MKISLDDQIKQSAYDLNRKKLLPERSLSLLTDVNAMKDAIYASHTDFFYEWKCPQCGIVVKGPKKWMIEHSKFHAEKKEFRENEVYTTNFKIY